MALKLLFFFFLSSFFFLYCKQLLFQTQNLSLPNHPWPFSSKPKTHKKKKRKKKRISHISLSFTLDVCMFPFFFSDQWFFLSLLDLFPFFFSDLWFFLSLSVCVSISSLSLSLSLSLSGHNNERGCDDGFVDVKSVEVSGIAEKGPVFWFETQ